MDHDLNRLRLFTTVARHLSFRRAAEALGLSPATVSERIRDLETALGVRLFNRTTRSVALTERGAALLTQVEPALATIGHAVSTIGVPNAELSGTLRINGPRPALDYRLWPHVLAFVAAHPAVQFDLVADDALSDVVAGGFDAGVRYGESLDGDSIAVSLGAPQRFRVVGAPDYLARHGMPAHPEALTRHRCLAQIFPRGNRLSWSFERGGREISITPDGPICSSEPSLQLEAAIAGLGLAFLFAEQCEAALAEGRVVSVLEDWTPPFPGPFLYFFERRLMPPVLRAFVDLIKSRVVGAV